MTAWQTILKLAARQCGVIAIRQAAGLGMDGHSFVHRARRDGWTQVWRGVWRMPGARADRRGQLWAAQLASGDHALVTGADGLWLQGVGRVPTAIPRLVVPMAAHAPRHLRDAVKVISSRTLLPGDRRRSSGIRRARASRCFVDLVIPPSPAVAQVRDLLVTARQARVISNENMAATLDRSRGVPGIGVLRRAVADVLGIQADSPFSDRVHRRLVREGFHPDPIPAPVVTPSRTLHPDITFKDRRVALECDSLLAHSDQRELMVDNRKDRAYKLARWMPLRIGPLEFHQFWPEFRADLQHALADARASKPKAAS